MVFVVTGWMRSGTSMMMQALEAGGLPVVRNTDRDHFAERHADDSYHPNGDGLYELLPREYQRGGFERDGHVVKVVAPWLHWLKRCDKAVLMLRDPEEIRQSYEAFTGHDILPGFAASYETRMQRCRVRLAELGADVTEFCYRDVLADPLSAMRLLQFDGWPIDAEQAAAVIQPERCRFRRELLAEGI
jgi:hypothetical protein